MRSASLSVFLLHVLNHMHVGGHAHIHHPGTAPRLYALSVPCIIMLPPHPCAWLITARPAGFQKDIFDKDWARSHAKARLSTLVKKYCPGMCFLMLKHGMRAALHVPSNSTAPHCMHCWSFG